MVLLHTSGAHFIWMDQLDRETDWKLHVTVLGYQKLEEATSNHEVTTFGTAVHMGYSLADLRIPISPDTHVPKHIHHDSVPLSTTVPPHEHLVPRCCRCQCSSILAL
jgi:hypothetical protein